MKHSYPQLKKHLRYVSLLLLFLLLVPKTPIFAQVVEQVTINYIEATSSPDEWGNRVRAYITVSSAEQESVLGLSLSNFRALEDGNEIDIQDVSQTTDPMFIVLAIDTSGSMQAKDKTGKTSMEAAKEAAVEFISMLGDEDSIALYSFDNEPNFQSGFSTDHAASIEAVRELSAKYRAATCLYDTALEAVKKASEIPRGRRAVILLTDGKDEKGEGTCSIHSSNDVINAATTKTIRVPIYTMGVGPRVDAKELARMASLTGGRSMLASSISELPGFYRTIANQLKNQYVVEYISRSPSGEHSLVVKVEQDGSLEQDERRFWSPPLPVMQPPSVHIISPDPTEPVTGTVNIEVEVSSEGPISKVRYYVDAALKEEDTAPPFGEFQWDTTGLARGLHVIRVEAVNKNGQIGSEEITLNFTPPAPVQPQVETPVKPPEKPPAQPPVAPSKIPEEKKGGPSLLWVFIALLVVMIAAVYYFWRHRVRKKSRRPIEVARARRAPEPVKHEEAETQEPLISAREADEATTMDVRPSIDPLAKLTVLKSQKLDLDETFKVLGTAETTIGRSMENSIRIPDKSVSRRHAVISYAGGNFFIQDRGSTLGTKVDGRKVTAAGMALKDGARIELGPTTILEFTILVFGKEEKEDDDKTRIYDQD